MLIYFKYSNHRIKLVHKNYRELYLQQSELWVRVSSLAGKQTQRPIERAKDLEIIPHSCSYMTFEKGVQNIHWRRWPLRPTVL
jgi:hypothetical protein